LDNRAKGFVFCNEVKKILEGIGHVVDGPFFKSKWFNNRANPVHCDIFSVFDLVSFYQYSYFFHQVSDLGHKSEKIKAIQGKGMPGWVWSRVSNGRVFYRVFIVKSSGAVEEAEIRWKS
jgi:hypothetical protein